MDVVENRDVRVGFRVTGSEWVGVSQAAELGGVRVSEWLRRAVVEKLARDSGEGGLPEEQIGSDAWEAERATGAWNRERAEERRLQRIENMRRNAK